MSTGLISSKDIKSSLRKGKSLRAEINELFYFLLSVKEHKEAPILEQLFVGDESEELSQAEATAEKA